MPVVVLGTAVLLWHLYRQVNGLYQEMAIQGAVLQAQTIEQMRQVYAGEVVERLRDLGIEATHDYIDQPRNIPLPATLTTLAESVFGVPSHAPNGPPMPGNVITGTGVTTTS